MSLIGRFIGVLLLMLAAFGAGYFLRDSGGRVGAQAEPRAEAGAFPLLDEAIDYVNNYYVKEQPDPQSLEYALIRAYLGGLGDPNTFFIEPAVAASESHSLAGRYGGIGVDLRRDEGGYFILYPFPESSAARIGILDGDRILAINDEPLDLSRPLDEVRQALRGELVEGAGVNLVVQNIAGGEERAYFIPFEEILVPSVTWRILFEAPQIGYIQLARFTSRTPEEFQNAVDDLRAQGATDFVLDLRDNPGGLLAESIQIAGEFFDGGTLSIEQRVGGETLKTDSGGGILLDEPIVVLVNRGTASASEIVAGALQARERGILIGQQTYGKGSIQSIFALSDASSIHVTVALWYTPDGNPLDGQGLTPDITMIPDQNGRDVELGEAIRYLQSQP